jgi:uncharacterized paraquat-inducible protein A
MAIVFPCKCGRELAVPDLASGLRARCPRCGATVHVPTVSTRRSESTDADTWRFLLSQAKSSSPWGFR